MDENNQEIQETNQEAITPEVPEVDPYVETAVAQGWRPKEEWDGPAHEWRPAKEFVERGELFSKIHDLKSENKQIREALQSLNQHHQKVRETEFKRALQQLREEKKSALQEGDADKLLQVEEAIDILKEKQQEEAQQPAAKAAGPTPTFQAWVQTNSWYLSDPEMREYADSIGVGYFSRNPGKTEPEVYDYVQKQVRKTYPEKFKGKAPSAPAVEGGSGGGTPPVKKDSFTLSDEEERVMKTFVRQGIMTADEYKAELKRVKGTA